MQSECPCLLLSPAQSPGAAFGKGQGSTRAEEKLGGIRESQNILGWKGPAGSSEPSSWSPGPSTLPHHLNPTLTFPQAVPKLSSVLASLAPALFPSFPGDGFILHRVFPPVFIHSHQQNTLIAVGVCGDSECCVGGSCHMQFKILFQENANTFQEHLSTSRFLNAVG